MSDQDALERKFAYYAFEAAKFREFKSCAGKAKYHAAMAILYETQCEINKRKTETDISLVDPELVAAVGEKFARMAKGNQQEAAFKRVVALRKAGKLSADELVFILDSGQAASVTEKELA